MRLEVPDPTNYPFSPPTTGTQKKRRFQQKTHIGSVIGRTEKLRNQAGEEIGKKTEKDLDESLTNEKDLLWQPCCNHFGALCSKRNDWYRMHPVRIVAFRFFVLFCTFSDPQMAPNLGHLGSKMGLLRGLGGIWTAFPKNVRIRTVFYPIWVAQGTV